MNHSILRIAGTACVAMLLAGCSTQVATVVSHDEGGRAVSVSARGAWPLQGYDDVQSEVQDAVREACEFAFTIDAADAASNADGNQGQSWELKPAPFVVTDFDAAVGAAGEEVIGAVGKAAAKLIEETPVHTLQWTGSCTDLFTGK